MNCEKCLKLIKKLIWLLFIIYLFNNKL
jgi:hypothetical protein